MLQKSILDPHRYLYLTTEESELYNRHIFSNTQESAVIRAGLEDKARNLESVMKVSRNDNRTH